MSEMQKAEADMARDKGVPVIKLHLDVEVASDGEFAADWNLFAAMLPPLRALAAAMQTAPEAVRRADEAVKRGDEAARASAAARAGHEWKPADVLGRA